MSDFVNQTVTIDGRKVSVRVKNHRAWAGSEILRRTPTDAFWADTAEALDEASMQKVRDLIR